MDGGRPLIEVGSLDLASPVIPAKAGTHLAVLVAGTTSKSNIKMGSSFRWNDGEVWNRHVRARALRAWIPAFAGMTIKSEGDQTQ